jgi:hypothetical protein
VGLLAAAGVAIALLSGGGGGGKASSTPVIAELGGTPGGITVGASGGAWVTLPDDGEIVRILPGGGARRIHVGGHPNLIASGPSGLWLTDATTPQVAQYDAVSGTLHPAVTLPGIAKAITVDHNGIAWVADSTGAVTPVGPGGPMKPARVSPVPTDVGAGEGWVWAVNGDPKQGLVRLEPAIQSQTPFDAGPQPVSVTFDAGVWTAHPGGLVTRFDPRSQFQRVVERVAIPGGSDLDGIAAAEGGGDVWAISSSALSLYRIPAHGSPSVTGMVHFSSPPVDLSVSLHAVWVVTMDGHVTRIDY